MAKDGPTYGNGKVCYIEIPALQVDISANFYRQVFGWNVRKRGDGATAFDDIVNEVSGAWVEGRKPMADVGLLIYIMVDDLDKTVEEVKGAGGKIIQPPGTDAPELTARFSDPAGNIIGLYQPPNSR